MQIDLRSCQQLALHGHHSMALLRSGAVTVWGPNENGLLGLGSKGPNASRSPTIIPDIAFSQVRTKIHLQQQMSIPDDMFSSASYSSESLCPWCAYQQACHSPGDYSLNNSKRAVDHI